MARNTTVRIPEPVADSPAHYRFSEEAQLRLTQVCDQLSLLATLTMPTSASVEEALHIQPAALAQCFSQLADAMQEALTDAEWHPA